MGSDGTPSVTYTTVRWWYTIKRNDAEDTRKIETVTANSSLVKQVPESMNVLFAINSMAEISAV